MKQPFLIRAIAQSRFSGTAQARLVPALAIEWVHPKLNGARDDTEISFGLRTGEVCTASAGDLRTALAELAR
jgi:hypothetical protein